MIAAFTVAQVDQFCRDLGVGLGFKGVAFFEQHFAEHGIVFDDAVVHDLHARIAVRVRVFIRRCAVRSPAGVTDADMRAGKIADGGEFCFKSGNLADRFQNGHAAVFKDGDARGVVTAVFERVKPL